MDESKKNCNERIPAQTNDSTMSLAVLFNYFSCWFFLSLFLCDLGVFKPKILFEIYAPFFSCFKNYQRIVLLYLSIFSWSSFFCHHVFWLCQCCCFHWINVFFCSFVFVDSFGTRVSLTNAIGIRYRCRLHKPPPPTTTSTTTKSSPLFYFFIPFYLITDIHILPLDFHFRSS